MTQPPPYGQPGQPPPYGQPGQPGQPGQAGQAGQAGQPYATQSAYAPPPEYREPVSRFNVVAGAFVLLGAVALVLAFTVLKWFRSDSGSTFFDDAGGDSTFSKISKGFANTKSGVPTRYRGDLSFGVSDLYFGWLGWTLLAVAVVLGVLAVLPLASGSGPLKLLAVIACLAGVAITIWALRLVSISGELAKVATGRNGFPTFSDYLKHSFVGAWAAVAGFVLILIGALLPRRRQASRGY